MGKAERNRKQSARERIAAQQAAARKAEARRRMLLAGGAIAVVLAVVVVFIVIRLGKSSSPASSSGRQVLPASVLKDVYTVPPATLDKVGAGSVLSFNPQPVTAVSDTPLTSAGKPEMLYIGAEFCPYCAAMRWSMAVALSSFGTFTTPLRGIHSSSTDTDPSTPTLTFYQSGYRSKYLEFDSVENETVTHAPLQSTSAAQTAIWDKYDANSYPFIDFGNKYVIKAPLYNPQVLHGLTWAQVAADLHNPSSLVAQGALGAANYITAAICKMTNNAPASVCTSGAVSGLEGKL